MHFVYTAFGVVVSWAVRDVQISVLVACNTIAREMVGLILSS